MKLHKLRAFAASARSDNKALADRAPLLTIVTLLACMSSSTAWAASVVAVTSTLQDVRYKLIDLDPSDGVTPWVLFGTPAASTDLPPRSIDTKAETMVLYGNEIGPTPHIEVISTTIQGDMFAKTPFAMASLDGVASVGRTEQGLSATVDIPISVLTDPRNFTSPTQLSFRSHAELMGTSSSGRNFSLSPKTRLIIEGVADSGVNVDHTLLGAPELDLMFANPLVELQVKHWAQASVNAYFIQPTEWVSTWGGASSMSTHHLDRDGAQQVYIQPDYPAIDHEVISAELTNDTSQTMSGGYNFIVAANVRLTSFDPSAPLGSSIPEPSMLALQILGLAGLAVLAHGRRMNC